MNPSNISEYKSLWKDPVSIIRLNVFTHPVGKWSVTLSFILPLLTVGMSYSSGPSASPLLSSTADAGTSDVGASSMSASDASNDAVNAHAASSSSGMIGGGGVMGAASSSSTGVASGSHLDPGSLVLSKKRLQDLVKEIDPMEVLDEDVEDVLLQVSWAKGPLFFLNT